MIFLVLSAINLSKHFALQLRFVGNILYVVCGMTLAVMLGKRTKSSKSHSEINWKGIQNPELDEMFRWIRRPGRCVVRVERLSPRQTRCIPKAAVTSLAPTICVRTVIAESFLGPKPPAIAFGR